MTIWEALTQSAAEKFWHQAGVIDGYIIVFAVALEIIPYLPQSLLFQWLQSPARQHRITGWAVFILILALMAEIPITSAKDRVAQNALLDVAARVNEKPSGVTPRHLLPEQAQELATAMSQWTHLSGGEIQQVSVFPISTTFEAANLANEIAGALGKNGAEWNVNRGAATFFMNFTASGVGLLVSSSKRGNAVAQSLADTLNRLGIATAIFSQKRQGCEDSPLQYKDQFETNPWCSQVSVEVGDHP